MKRSKSRFSLFNRILSNLDLVFWILERPANFRYEYLQGRMSREEWEKIKTDRRQNRIIRELKQRKRISDRKKGREVIIRLHKDAAVAVLKEQVREETRELPNAEYVLVLFDFPVSANRARQMWRNFLHSADFSRVQLSAMTTRHAVLNPVRALVRLLVLEKWVRVYRVKDPGV